jgi:uncharacterized tellurite resistance protein B-like protein
MLAMIRKALQGGIGGGREKGEERQQTIHLAAGVLLLEAAHVDDDCTAEEMEHVVQTMRDKFSLSEEYLAELLEVAHLKRGEAIDLWQFTNRLNQEFSKEEKLLIMEDVWRIIFIDGRLDKHEDHFAHKLANLLRLTHKEMIDAKLRGRQ